MNSRIAETTIVVFGAGINGAALARELLLSGVSVAVVDTADIASGATAWSTRLVHGGLRYLEYGEFGLVRESLRERGRLVRLAPHLVRPLEFYLPVAGRLGGLVAAAARLMGLESLARACSGHRGRGGWAIATGLALYDLLAAGSGWPRHRMVRAGRPGQPAVDPSRYPLAGIYSDAQMLFPERFTVELLVDARRIAQETGARFSLFTHHAASLGPDGRLRLEPLAGARDDAGGGIELQPAAIINATGAWVDRTLASVLPADPTRPLIGGTKGSHLILRAPALRSALGAYGVYAEAADGRPVFVLPFGERLVLVGTTDIPFTGDPAAAHADEEEIDYLLRAVARIFPAAAARREDVAQHYCGVRPLPAARADGRTAAITRRHLLVRQREAPLPCWSIVGGKLTTCRSLAESAAREVLGALGVSVRGTSRDRPLPGACEGPSRAAAEKLVETRVAAAGASADTARVVAHRLVDLFGARGPEVCAALEPQAPLIADTGLPAAAVRWCVREEWAASLEDVMERRLMLSFDERLTRQAVEEVARVLVQEGVLQQYGLEAEVDGFVRHLRDRYGKDVT
jgi:glycerol-3-phosphate dehydrogenase